MKKVKRFVSILSALMLALSLISLPALAEETVDLTTLYKNKDVTTDWSGAEATAVDLSALESSLIITTGGEWVLSGETAYPVIIEAGEEDDVRLILNGAAITCSEGPAILEKSADKLILTLAEGTVNTLTDAASLTEGEETWAAAVCAEDDLSINGSGTLIVNGSAGHGIQSKADLIIAGGVLQVTALKDSIRGKNSVLVLDGEITVVSQGDGITAIRDDKEGKGWVLIADGTLNITTGSGAGEDISLSGASAMAGGFQGRGGMGSWSSTAAEATDSASVKGIKAATDLTVLGGTLVLNTEDDGLHANNITVSGGTLTIRSGDDAMHADTDLIVSDGTVNVEKCTEGLEGYNITVSGGNITILSSDDGLNAAGGTDSSGTAGTWGGMDNFNSEMDNGSLLSITGGTLSITAGNDGIDSNGDISITGGVIGVWTASNDVDGALDFNGTATMTGGTLIIANATATTSLAAAPSGTPLMAVSLDQTFASGTVIELKDGSGNTLGTFAPQSSYTNIIIASSALAEGDSLTLTAGGTTVYSGTFTANVTTGMGGFGGGMGGGFGGGMGGGFGGGPGENSGSFTPGQMGGGTLPSGGMGGPGGNGGRP